MNVHGQCLCEKVQITAEVKEAHFDVCHCSMCRTWGGGPLLAVGVKSFAVNDEARITVFDSSPWAERGFCAECGTHLFYRMKEKDFYSVPLGILENQDRFEFALQIYVDKKPSSYDFANKTKMMTESQVLEAFGLSGEKEGETTGKNPQD